MPSSKILATSFDTQGVYPCPVCHVGKITPMTLMEAMACDFCQQIFTVSVENQQIKMPSRQPPLTWRWNGFSWTEGHLEGVEFGWGYVLAATMFVILPTALIGTVAYYFPPHPDTPLSWVPYIWTVLTLFSHLTIVVWLLIEIYQIPVRAYLRAIRQRFPMR
jgi:hypothetical protein